MIGDFRKERRGETMLKNRREAATEVATKLHRAETAVDEAIVALGELFTGLPQAQATANLSPVSGDAAMTLASAAIGAMCASRANVVQLHHELARVRDGIGLKNFRVVGTGDAAKILKPEGSSENDDAPAAKANIAAA
ncbi:MAG: hypothetical protein A2885_18335 [Sphingopyxis sp. RIFCSPHIGHO2_01_FULL_65_24]|nr:MAG: hypothetical protein A2885_18335 [Sphingopyxis sp. RIFCSPHIGHO2_01_FULL_65_24]